MTLTPVSPLPGYVDLSRKSSRSRETLASLKCSQMRIHTNEERVNLIHKKTNT